MIELSVPLPLERQIGYATEFFTKLVSSYGRRRYPTSVLHEPGRWKVWRTDFGPVTIKDCTDGIYHLVKTGKIRIIKETAEIEVTDKFGIVPKVKLEIEFDRELSIQYQAELKGVEEAHGLLYQFENALRSFVVETLSSSDPEWMSHLVEEATRKKWESIKEQEKQYPWLGPVEHELIYYSDLRDLVQMMNRNWERIFSKKLGSKAREAIVPRIVELEAIRNIVAHNRLVSDEALSHLKRLWDDFSLMIKKGT